MKSRKWRGGANLIVHSLSNELEIMLTDIDIADIVSQKAYWFIILSFVKLAYYSCVLQVMFWSGTRELTHAYTRLYDKFTTLEDTLAG